ncbi:ABC transporter ATP-binding protein [Clostridium tetani]|uniref:ABC transporter ATP-binding protein n=1 Tax=Clostridium tetani TaxID=1513 RepID=UPI000E15DF95|nr:ABC transporter ATP-binding protein [Clostridium tetani]RXI76959.1 ABC transporter ATP-binding protein [Clostridium tetani]WFN61742.1 ABC transporter ATP-binding protein [Clostridium tetani]SUY57766.1 daunorubicin/doxorubicin resistance ATP-binding protein DrrA [Clostridium tetani]BDR70831.1 ABC transporter ATP-binding protein [Clostridium tetani]BEV20468.1 ABC transporter ATP-binding protein [Clostridium tetani]
MTAIRIENLIKKYDNGVQALNGLNLTVKEGEIFSLLGQNGAGKSTLIHILTTYLDPTSGLITMFGKDIYREASEIRTQISCVAQRTSIDTHLSLTENMMFQSKLYKVSKAEARRRMETLIDCFGLERYLKQPVSSYSGGIKRRLDIALNMMSNPKVLFLDEPTVGMDIQSRMAMWDMMKKIRNDLGTTIFLTTHYLEEAGQLSDTICIMKNGKEILQGTPHALREYLRKDILKISFLSKEEAKNCFQPLKGILDLEETDLRHDKIITDLKNGHMDLEKANRWLLEHKVPFLGIEIMQPTLEDVFIRLTDENGKEAC